MIPRRLALTGQRFGAWLVLEEAETEKDQTYWSCLCDCGTTAVIRGNLLSRGHATRCRACATRLGHTLPDEEVTYGAVHMRLRKQRGRASDHTCVCGECAEQWAYQHGDPKERIDLCTNRAGRTVPMALSPNLDAYVPMCRSCHWQLDRRHVQEIVG